jgi:hypothetical protein
MPLSGSPVVSSVKVNQGYLFQLMIFFAEELKSLRAQDAKPGEYACKGPCGTGIVDTEGKIWCK